MQEASDLENAKLYRAVTVLQLPVSKHFFKNFNKMCTRIWNNCMHKMEKWTCHKWVHLWWQYIHLGVQEMKHWWN